MVVVQILCTISPSGLGWVRCQQLARVIVIHYGRTTLDNSGQLGSSPATTWTWLLSADTHCMEETREADQSLQKCNTLTVTEFSCPTLRLCLLFYGAALSYLPLFMEAPPEKPRDGSELICTLFSPARRWLTVTSFAALAVPQLIRRAQTNIH